MSNKIKLPSASGANVEAGKRMVKMIPDKNAKPDEISITFIANDSQDRVYADDRFWNQVDVSVTFPMAILSTKERANDLMGKPIISTAKMIAYAAFPAGKYGVDDMIITWGTFDAKTNSLKRGLNDRQFDAISAYMSAKERRAAIYGAIQAINPRMMGKSEKSEKRGLNQLDDNTPESKINPPTTPAESPIAAKVDKVKTPRKPRAKTGKSTTKKTTKKADK